ncbi:MAG: B12-binding domain-containing radical SAM protein [Bacillota bacterium]
MNTLLLYPEFPDTFWSHVHALRIAGKKALLPPLGLLTVGAMLPPHWGKRLVDLNVASLSDADLAWADCVFVSAMIVQRETARRLIARCKAAGKTIVAGGPLFAAEYPSFPQVDHFVLNEGELTLSALVADLERGCAHPVYQSQEYADLTQSPTPLWELADLNRYSVVGVQFSRGCPYDCEFCNITALFGRQPRTKTTPQMIAELDALYQRQWRGPVFFVDDNLIGHRPALKDLLPALKQWQHAHGPMPFITQASINLADDQTLMQDMVDAGFTAVFVGIETPDPEALAECNKSHNRNRDLVGDVRRLQQHGLEVWAGFIVGFDHDTPSIFQRQAGYIEQSRIVTAMVGMLMAPPGTRLAQRLWREGRLAGASSGDNTDGTTNIIPKMGLEHLSDGYRWLLRRLYAPRPYYQRLKAFLREFRTPQHRNPLTWSRIWMFLRSIYHLGILGRERCQYWSLLFWTLLHRPALLPEAVRLAICGHHYRRLSEQVFNRVACSQ